MVEERVNANGVILWTVRQGAGPPLVLCHGGPGDHDVLGPVAAMVEALTTVFRYEQRGCGRSERTPPYDVATFVADLEGLRRHWGHERWIVGGHSWGAGLALTYAVHHPERVRALLYLSGTGITLEWRDEYDRNRMRRLSLEERERFADLRARRAAAEGREADQIAEAYVALLWSTNFADPSKASPPDHGPVNYEVNQLVGADWNRFLQQGDLSSQVRQLQFPALVVHGDSDPRPAWAAAHLAQLLPRAQFVLLPEVGHMPWLERPELLRKALRDFLTSLT